MINLNIESAVEHIKVLIDRNRCVICDLLNGPIVRYPCAHPVCEVCVKTTEDCLLCLSPPKDSSKLTDVPFSRRVKNVSLLLSTFQDLFNLDVYKRQRLSEQLKLEKQLFPKCIQAPSKYGNKRKSTRALKDKENSRESLIAGEVISNGLKMENTISYVQQWLNNNESSSKMSSNLPRKPFADLNVNDQRFSNGCSLVNKVNTNKDFSRKRTHLKIIDPSSKRLLSKKKKKESHASSVELRSPRDNVKTCVQKSKCENNESGIFIDEETIVIDDSQREYVDKDKLALIAVKEADKFNSCKFINSDQSEHNNTFKKICKAIDFEIIESSLYRTPFYKKSLLFEVCDYCTKKKNILQNIDDSKNLTVTIDNNKFITTITFSHCLARNIEIVNKQSVQIQTDTSTGTAETAAVNPHSEHKTVVETSEKTFTPVSHENIKSADLFIDDVKIPIVADKKDEYNHKNMRDTSIIIPSKRDKCVIIEDSDTDSDMSIKNNTLEVTAEVHKADTYDDYGVLSTLEPNEYEIRTKRNKVRGNTPLSTDSSDKENYDPNRMKKQKFSKKPCSKK